MGLFWSGVERGELRRGLVMTATLLVACGNATKTPAYVQDSAELDGKAFTLTESICPSENSGKSDRDGPVVSMRGFLVRQNEAGELELVSFTRPRNPVESMPRVQVRPLSKVGDGFEATQVDICAQELYAIENRYEVQQEAARRVRLEITRDPDGQLSAALTAETPEASISAHAVADTTAPELIATGGSREFLDESTTGLYQYFAFSEPLADTSQLGLVDSSGNDVAFESIRSEGFVVGIHVEDVISTQAHWQSKLIDLAGNAVRERSTYPGIALSPTTGDFEEEKPAFFTNDVWNDGVSNFQCSSRVAASSGSVNDGLLDVPAVSGEQSLLAGGDGDCFTYLRVVRPAGATRLLFDARDIHPTYQTEPMTLKVSLDSLAAGGDGSSTESSPDWQVDTEHSDVNWWVSGEQTLSFALPPEGDDFLLSIAPGRLQYLWLDSLRFE
jgi:hypothetical protein